LRGRWPTGLLLGALLLASRGAVAGPGLPECPEGHRTETVRQGFWFLADDRDNPAIQPVMARELARRMACTGVPRPVLLHGGDTYTHGWLRPNETERHAILRAWQPLREVPGLRWLLAPGNHEGTEGARLLARELDAPTRWPHARVDGRLRYLLLDTEDRHLVNGGVGGQAAWLQDQLRQAAAGGQLPVVVLHRPPAALSCGPHRDDAELRRWDRGLRALLGAAGEGRGGLLLGAHDHVYSRGLFLPGWSGAVVGIGGAPLGIRQSCPGLARVVAPTRLERQALYAGTLDPRGVYGFLECLVDDNSLECKVILLNREVVDRFRVPLPAPGAPAGAAPGATPGAPPVAPPDPAPAPPRTTPP